MTTYNISLRKEILKVPRYLRAKKAVRAVREFVAQHSKSSDVKIGEHLNLLLWKQGIKNPIMRVKVDIEKDAKGVANVELFGAPKEEKKPETKKKTAKKEATKGAAETVEATVVSETKEASASKPKKEVK